MIVRYNLQIIQLHSKCQPIVCVLSLIHIQMCIRDSHSVVHEVLIQKITKTANRTTKVSATNVEESQETGTIPLQIVYKHIKSTTIMIPETTQRLLIGSERALVKLPLKTLGNPPLQQKKSINKKYSTAKKKRNKTVGR